MTNHSLVANQRAHISLIDRRHQAPSRCLSGTRQSNRLPRRPAAGPTYPLTTSSHISAERHHLHLVAMRVATVTR